MNKSILRVLGCFGAASLLSVGLQAQMAGTAEIQEESLATAHATPGAMIFQTTRATGDLRLTIANPNGEVRSETFLAGTTPQFALEGAGDGVYRWELRDVSTVSNAGTQQGPRTAGGNFVIQGGEVVTHGEEVIPPDEQIIAEDLFVDGNLAAGTAVTGTELFTQLTVLLKEPLLRILFQDTSIGGNTNDWAILINDLFGDDYFAITDIDNGTNPLTLLAGAPDSSIYLDANGRLGLGTSTPTAAVDLFTASGINAAIKLTRDDGATGLMSAGGAVVSAGSTSDHPFQILAGTGGQAGWKMKVNQDQSLTMRNGATCTAGGVWTDSADSSSQRNVRVLSTEEALQTLSGLNPIRFESAAAPGEHHVGFSANEAPDMVVNADRTGMSAMDVTAVLTKVVQQQQATIANLERRLAELEGAKLETSRRKVAQR